MSWSNRFKNLFRTNKLDGEIGEELEFHLEARFRDNIRAGMPTVEARQDAVRRFGSRTRAVEGARDANILVWLDTVRQDLRYAFRTLLKNRGFATVAVVSLALGIGANTAIFSLIDTLLLRLLPVRNPNQLVILAIPGSGPKGRPGTSFSYPVYEEIRDGNSSFSGVTATFGVGRNAIAVDGQQDRVTLSWVSGTYFSVLGVDAILGRTFSMEEDHGFGNHPVAVIGHGYWQRRFGQDARVLGRTIVRDKKTFTIIGVAPPEFFGTEVGESVDVWLPLTMINPEFVTRGFQVGTLIARLNPGLSESAALAGVNVLFSQIRRHEDELTRQGDRQHRMTEEQHQKFLAQRLEFLPASRGLSRLREQFSRPLWVLMTVVGLVLLIACLNVANLLLARATARQREIAVRLSVGAGRGRIIRQLLTESALVAAAGGLLGIGVAFWASKVLIRMVGSGPDPIGVHFQLNVEVLVFTVAVSLLTGLLFGLAPAFSATRINVAPMLKDASRGAVLGGASRMGVHVPLRKALVGIQIALSLMVLVGAGLLIRTLQNLLSLDAGFDRSSVLLASVRAPRSGPKGVLLVNEFREVLRQVPAIPGVRSASLSSYRFFGGMSWTDPPYIDGFPSRGECYLMGVSPDFFETMGVRLSVGRVFTERDDELAPAVAVVSESMARHYFGDVSPLGRHFGWSPRQTRQIEIVGVVKDAKWRDLRADSPPFIYFPYFQWQASPYNDPKAYPGSDAYLELRTFVDPAGLSKALRQEVASRSGFQTGEIVTQAALVEQSVATERLLAKLSGVFGILALLLACIGLYGLMSYTVQRRTNEIGVRIALGAGRSDIIGMVFRETLLLVAAGLAIGVPAALVCARFIGSFLFGLSPTDAATVASAAVSLLAVGGLAGYLPARRASRTDPMVALRYE